MAHKVCIDGTAYEIDGGKAMVGGTVYEIDHGVANVDGTAHEVGFVSGFPITLTLLGTANISMGIYYDSNLNLSASKPGTIYVPEGAIVLIHGSIATYLGSNGVAVVRYSDWTINGTHVSNAYEKYFKVNGELNVAGLAMMETPKTGTFIWVTKITITGDCEETTYDAYKAQFS